MSDSFNPQELLSKLRAKSTNSTAASVAGSVTNEQPVPQRRYSGAAESEQKSIGANRVQATSNIRTPLSLTLTPSQRQENLNARLELEREIKRLQDEVTHLVSENIQLKRDKEDVEQQFIDFRVKSEDTITKLRGKIAAISLSSAEGPADRGAGAGRLYAQKPTDSASKLNTSLTRSPNSKLTQRQLNTPQSGGHGGGYGEQPPPPPPPLQAGFRDPTFSELMRRSTPDHHDFRDALRRNGSTKLGTGLPVNPPGSQQVNPTAQAHAHPHSNHANSVHSSGGSGAGANAQHYAPAHGINPALMHAGGVGTPNANPAMAFGNQRTKSVPNMSNPFMFSDAPNSESKQQQMANAQQHGDGGNNHHSAYRQNSISSMAEMDSFMHANTHHTHGSQHGQGSMGGQMGSGNAAHGYGGPGKHAGGAGMGNAGPMEYMNMQPGSNSGNAANSHAHHAAYGNNSHHHGGGHNASHQHHGMDYNTTGETAGGSYSDSEDLPVLEIDLTN